MSRANNYGHVPWSPSANLWKLAVTPPPVSGKEKHRMVRCKIMRPESSGCNENLVRR